MRDTFKVEASRELAKSLWREGKFDEAREVLSPVIALPGVPRDLVIATTCVLSIVEQCGGRPRKAIEILRVAEGLVVATRDAILRGQWLNTMGINLKLVRDHDSALTHLTAAVESHELGKAFDYAAQSRANIGNLFIDLEKPDIAHNYLDAVLCRCETPEIIAQALESKARALLMEGRHDEAEKCALRSVALLEEAGDKPALLDLSYRTLGKVRFVRVHGREVNSRV
jgi:tetratricopeptide (TPR) repeat protein